MIRVKVEWNPNFIIILDRIYRIHWIIFFFSSFQMKLEKPNPPAAENLQLSNTGFLYFRFISTPEGPKFIKRPISFLDPFR